MNKLFRVFAAGTLASSLLLAGCSSSANGEDETSGGPESSAETAETDNPIAKTRCSVYNEDGNGNPRVVSQEMTVEDGTTTGQTIFYYLDKPGFTDKAIKESMPDTVDIKRTDGMIIIYKPKTEKTFNPGTKTNAENMESVIKGFLENTSKNNIQIACDISDEELQEQINQVKAHESAKSEQKSEGQAKQNSPASGIRPEFQKAMDDYLAFFREYADFMKNYSESGGTDTSLMSDYLNFMTKYSQTMESFDAVDTEDLSNEELQLYIDTNAEIQKLLLGAM